MTVRGLTAYQHELLVLVQTGDPDGAAGDLVDFDQVLDRLSWLPSKQSAQFTVRALITKGLILKEGLVTRRGRKRVVYSLTAEGRRVFDPRGPSERSSEGFLERSPEVSEGKVVGRFPEELVVPELVEDFGLSDDILVETETMKLG